MKVADHHGIQVPVMVAQDGMVVVEQVDEGEDEVDMLEELADMLEDILEELVERNLERKNREFLILNIFQKDGIAHLF